jgi:hypothetical protein
MSDAAFRDGVNIEATVEPAGPVVLMIDSDQLRCEVNIEPGSHSSLFSPWQGVPRLLLKDPP